MKSIEEAAKEHAIRNGMAGWLYNSFKSGVEFAERWIPVHEELPDKKSDCEWSELVIVMSKDFRHGYGITTYNHVYEEWVFMGEEITVTHWRPINHK